MPAIVPILLLLASAVALCPAASAQPAATGQRAPVARIGDQLVAVPPGGAEHLPVFATGSLAAPDPRLRRVVIVLHGALRNADSYLDGMVAAATAAGALEGTLIVAPQFLADVDAAGRTIDPSILRWTIEGWKEGAGAMAPAGADPVASSAFAALDAVLALFADRTRFPGLETVVIAGHSAGGQVLARYAPTNRGDGALQAAGIRVRYVIANPSTYLYVDPRRPAEGGGFAAYPSDRCAAFDDYKYGMQRPNPYVAAVPVAAIVPRFLAREVVFLLGESDDDPAHRLLDRSCAAMAQGPHRYARGRAYVAYLRTLAGDSAPHHRLLVVPGVGHNNRSMFGSPCGQAALFGAGNC